MSCDAFVCRIRDTCLYGSDCHGPCRPIVDRCQACVLQHGCKGDKRGFYKVGKEFFREVKK